MTQTDRVPTRALRKRFRRAKARCSTEHPRVRTRQTNAQMVQFIEAAEASERNLLRSITTRSGVGR